MFKKQLKKWGFDAKYVKHEEALLMSRLKHERDAAQKPSEFTVRGQPVDFKKVTKHIKRRRPHHRNLQIDETGTSSRVLVRTPSPEPELQQRPCRGQLRVQHSLDELDNFLKRYVNESLSGQVTSSPCYFERAKSLTSMSDPGWPKSRHLGAYFHG